MKHGLFICDTVQYARRMAAQLLSNEMIEMLDFSFSTKDCVYFITTFEAMARNQLGCRLDVIYVEKDCPNEIYRYVLIPCLRENGKVFLLKKEEKNGD